MTFSQKFTIFQLRLYASALLILFAAMSGVVFFHVADADTYVDWIKSALAMLFGHILTMINPRAVGALPKPPGEPDA